LELEASFTFYWEKKSRSYLFYASGKSQLGTGEGKKGEENPGAPLYRPRDLNLIKAIEGWRKERVRMHFFENWKRES